MLLGTAHHPENIKQQPQISDRGDTSHHTTTTVDFSVIILFVNHQNEYGSSCAIAKETVTSAIYPQQR